MSVSTTATPSTAMSASNALASKTGTRYFRAGQGTSVVLIHGVGLDATIWQAQFDALSKQFDVIAYDMLGHGGSPAPADNASLKDYVTQLTELMSELNINTTAIVGFSMGGLIARLTAIEAPALVERLVVLASVFDRSEEQSKGILARVAEVRDIGPKANIDAAIERWFSPQYIAKHKDEVNRIRSLVMSNNPRSYYISYSLFARNDNAGRTQLDEIQAPVMVITGEEDVGSTPEMAKALALALPNATYTVLPGMKHMLVMEHATAVNKILYEFLTQRRA